MDDASAMRCRGLRGATTAADNSTEAILAATRELLERLMARNALAIEDIASAFFTVTDDLDAAYPALAARALGWTEVALLCAREIPVPGSVARCIRVLLHINTTKGQGDLRHVYLREAVGLRPGFADAPSTAAPSAAVFDRVAIIGLGLMGASLGVALRTGGHAHVVAGYDSEPGIAARAQQLGAIDVACDSLRAAVAESDLVVLATPVQAMRDLLEGLAPLLDNETVVTDLGSAKAAVVAWAESLLAAPGQFVGGHPMAGSEQSGVEAANADLFRGCAWCLTPSTQTSDAAIQRVTLLAKTLGARVRMLTPDQHDQAVALVSHLPLLAATALTLTVGQSSTAADALTLAAGGFRDTTRVASGSPRMARDICIANRSQLLASLDRYLSTLQAIRDHITEPDDVLEELFAMARDTRNHWVTIGGTHQDTGSIE
ncbi:MAG TPA: chorismate mutase [Ktedonobacterales bacterium]|nr:chorismate mutase [Ktedonobacterales bacterium]